MSDFELLIVDDCSTDDTVRIAEQFAANDQRIRVHRNQQNRGLVGNWNHSIELANGEWIKFLFQDDHLAPTCLERMLAAGHQTGARLVFCEREILIEEGADPNLVQFFTRYLTRFADVFGAAEIATPSDICRAIIGRLAVNFLGEPTSTLIHRSCFARYGSFNAALVQICDLEFWLRVGCQEPLGLVTDRLATFRVHGASTSNSNHGSALKRFRMLLDAVVLLTEFLTAPAFHQLREVTPDANNYIRGWFLYTVQDVELRILRATGHERAALLALWGATRKGYPTVELLMKTAGPAWRRSLRQARTRIRALLPESIPHRPTVFGFR